MQQILSCYQITWRERWACCINPRGAVCHKRLGWGWLGQNRLNHVAASSRTSLFCCYANQIRRLITRLDKSWANKATKYSLPETDLTVPGGVIVFIISPAMLPTLVECISDCVLLCSSPGTMIGWALLISRRAAAYADPAKSLSLQPIENHSSLTKKNPTASSTLCQFPHSLITHQPIICRPQKREHERKKKNSL